MTQNLAINNARARTSKIYGTITHTYENIEEAPEYTTEEFRINIFLYNGMGSVGYITGKFKEQVEPEETNTSTFDLNNPNNSIIVTNSGNTYSVDQAVYHPYNIPNEVFTFYGIYSNFDSNVSISPNA